MTSFGICKRLGNGLVLGALYGFILGCAAQPPADRPTEKYRGPIAERPLVQRGEYWVYDQNAKRVKTNTLALDLGFPLWIGRIWSYDSEALPWTRDDPKSRLPRTPVRIECHVMAFSRITVEAGTFDAFRCECECKTISVAYEPECGEWTVWYAAAVKNIIRTTAGAPTGILELMEYKAAR